MCRRTPSRGPARRLLLRLALVFASIAILITSSTACRDDRGNGTTGGGALTITFGVTPPAGGTTDVIHFAEDSSNGGMLLVDVLARDVTSDFDGYNVEIAFDPIVAEAFGLVQGTILDTCSGLQPLKADNVANGNANDTGFIVFGASLPGALPPACTVPGTALLARLTLRARGPGKFPLQFVSYNDDPNAPSGSRFFRTTPPVPAIPLTWENGEAMVSVD